MERLINHNDTQVDQVKINIDLLYPSPLNSFEVDDINELAENIRYFGLLSPLSVAGPDENGKYEILAGERRYQSIRKLNEEMPGYMQDIPCYIVGESDMSPIRKQLVIEVSNLESRDDYNRDTHRFQVVKLYKQLADEGSIEEKDLVKKIGESLKMSKRYSGMYMTIFRSGIEELRESVESVKKEPDPSDDGPVHIPVSVASRIAKLDPDLQRKVIIRINNGEDPVEVLNQVKKKKEPVSLKTEDTSFTAISPDDDFGFEDTENSDEYEELSSSEGYQAPSFSDTDASLRDAVQNQDEFDAENLDVLGYMKRNTPRVDLSMDTSGELGRMKESERPSSLETEERRHVAFWIRRISKKIDREDPLDEEDVNLLEQMTPLVEQYNAL